MDFAGILRRSWELTRHHRWLWWLGILAAATEGTGGSSGNLPTDFSDTSTDTPSLTEGQLDPTSLLTDWTRTDTLIVIGVVAVILLLWLGFLYLSYSSKAGLILATNELETSGKALGFKAAFHQGRAFSWRLFGLSLLVGLLVFVIIIASGALPLALYFLAPPSTALTILLVILVILFVLVMIAVSCYFAVVLKVADRILILKNQRVMAALRAAQRLIRHQWKQTGLAFLVTIGVSLVVSMVMLLGLLVILGVLVGVGFLIYSTLEMAGVLIYGGLTLIALLIALAVWSGVYTAFMSNYWTLSYRALNYLADHPNK